MTDEVPEFLVPPRNVPQWVDVLAEPDPVEVPEESLPVMIESEEEAG